MQEGRDNERKYKKKAKKLASEKKELQKNMKTLQVECNT